MPRMDSAAETDGPAEMWLSSPNPPWKYSTSAGTWQGRFQRHDMIRLGSGDGPLSVRGCPSTVKGTRHKGEKPDVPAMCTIGRSSGTSGVIWSLAAAVGCERGFA